MPLSVLSLDTTAVIERAHRLQAEAAGRRSEEAYRREQAAADAQARIWAARLQQQDSTHPTESSWLIQYWWVMSLALIGSYFVYKRVQSRKELGNLSSRSRPRSRQRFGYLDTPHSAADLELWVETDPKLHDWWQSEGTSLRRFVRRYRDRLERHVQAYINR